MPRTLIDPTTATDAGGVAGRRGYRFQDHVGAGFVISMLADAELRQVEFETADDIVLRWLKAGQEYFEYVQVKTTAGDSLWGLGELFSRDNGRLGTSVVERSLACDKHGGSAMFRMVSSRDVKSVLKPFCVERNRRRIVSLDLSGLIDRVGTKLRGVRSPSGRTSRDWASELFWKVEPDQASLQAVNVNHLIQQAGSAGETPSHAQAVAIYDELIAKVSTAGDASQINDPDAKGLDRDAALRWWQVKLADLRIANRGSLKVYRVSTEAFFSDLHQIDEVGIRRSLRSYDVEFDEGIWRAEELIDHLLRWLPELALPAKILAEFSHLDARGLVARAVTAFEERGVMADQQLMAELLLHAVLRHYFDSEPIACKVFHGHGSTRGSTSAHVVPSPDGDQLWLGRARLTTATTYDDVVAAVVTELEAAIGRDIIRAERNLILSLREPRHMRGSTIEATLGPRGKTEELVKCLHLPVLVAYDSRVVGAGFAVDYVERLRDETAATYHDLKTRLPHSLRDMQVHLFLVPIEDAATLVPLFSDRLRGR